MSRLLLSNKLCQVMEINKLSFNSLHAGLLFMILLSFADFFSKSTFSKTSFRKNIGLPIGLDPDQDRLFVGPDLGPNCFGNVISRGHKSLLAKKELKLFC